MSLQQWLERVAKELAGRGLPAGVRARLMDELRDHWEDHTQGGTDVATEIAVERKMGYPEDVATLAIGEYRRAAWIRRHPLLAFGLAPIPITILGVVLYILLAGAVAYVVAEIGFGGGFSSLPRDRLESAASAFIDTVGFVPFLGAVVVFGWVAIRNRLSAWWLAVAVAQVALLAGAATAQLKYSNLPGQSQLTLGVGFPWSDWQQVVQLLLPLAIGAVFLRMANRRLATAM